MMKLKMSLAFIALYIISLVLTIPAHILTRFMPENTGVQIGAVHGTIWNGELSQVDYRQQFQLQKVAWKFDWLALFTLNLKADIKFDNGQKILAGEGAISYGTSGLSISNLHVNAQAASLMPYLKLPVPIIPSGKFALAIENATLGTPYCSQLDGYLVWHDGKVTTPMGKIDFATPNVDLSCTEGNLLAQLKQHSKQLTTNAKISLKAGGSYQLEGDIIGHESLDPSILQALTWLGPKNKAGEIPLNFKGRL